MTASLVGQTLGGSYTVIRVVGEGGMGTVYEARHLRVTTRRFAIKTLHPEYLRDAEARARFQREAEAAAAISSPHVAGVCDVGRTDDGTPYLVSEFLDGEDLNARLEKVGRLPVGAMARIARQVCRGLAAAHARGVVHRDIKPANVFLTGDPAHPSARIVDFGISRVDAEGTQLTKTGMIMGTPAYMAPEQARGQRIDVRADIYAVGALLYRGLTGSLPFERSDPSAVLAAVLLEEPPPVRVLMPEIPPTLELVIQRAMAKEPAARFADARALEDALAPFEDAAATPSAGVAVPKARAPAGSMASLPGWHAADVRFARPMLVAYALVGGVSALIALWMTAGVAAVYARGGDASDTLTPAESTIAAAIIGLVALTPAVLFAMHVRRTAWASTMKALDMLDRLRAPVVAGLTTYGFMWLLLRSVEAVVMRRSVGAAWPAWDAVTIACALGAALYARRGKTSPPRTRALPRPATLGVATLVLFLSTALVSALRGDAAATADDEKAEEDGGARRRRGKADDEASEPGSDPKPVPVPASERATPEALAAAKSGGAPALAALAEKFPDDPAVLEALAVAQGIQPASRKAALATIARLLAVDPDAVARNAMIERIVRDAADGPEDQSRAAFDLLAEKMGSRGPDILYELMTARPALSARAIEQLAKPAVRKRATPALRIAFDLRTAKDCDAIKPLLELAAKDGDDRAVSVLSPLVTASSRRCGFLKLETCSTKARCAAQAGEIQKSIAAIRGRGGK